MPGGDLAQLIKEKIEALIDATSENQGDLGGWLLEPLFMLVNFVFDSLTSHLGHIMNNEDGFLYGKTEPTIDTSTLTYKDVVKVNVADFGVAHVYHTVTYTPEEIFSGKIDLLSIDFISGNKADGTAVTDDGWLNIRSVIAQWYKVLRMIAIIGLLSVLIYTGIKIIISANAKDKAKYKEWIINWFIAVAILFTMHYLMAFITSVTGEFSNLLNEANGKVIVEEVDSETELNNQSVNTDKLFETNLMGLVRFRVQDNDMGEKIAYEVMYVALFIYTVKFTFVYLKRVLNMAFLTLIAPIVALTYPIDKLNDGNAQGFNMWLKEYIFNALLQPMHLVMYYILVGSAVSVAASNPLYGIVVLAFMTEAEKLLKKIFGFDKANGGTVGGMAGAFAAGALASSVKNIAKLAGKGSGGNGGKVPSGGDKNPALDNPKPTEKDSDMNAFLDSPEGEDNNNTLNEENDEDKTTEQKMFDADEENGEFDDDPEYREAMARDAYGEQEGQDLSDEERREMLREQGWSEEEINDTFGVPPGAEEGLPTESSSDSNIDNQQPIDEMAAEREKRRQQRINGAKAVGKRLLKPAWDTDHKLKNGDFYNVKRWGRRIAKATLGAGIGITAAAVQAGISITDGKYNPLEGIATFSAGYAGGSGLANRMIDGGVGIVNAYKDGATSGDTKAQMERAQKRFASRDDVIEFNKKQYPGQEQERMERERDNYLPVGVHDLKDMKSCMKYADKLKEKGMGEKDADRRAAATLDFKNRLKEQGQLAAIYDKKKQEQYIKTMVEKAKQEDKETTRKKYENAFKSIVQYDQVNS